MSGLLLFARVDPRCASGGGVELVPLVLDPLASVQRLIDELKAVEAVSREVDVEWHGRRLAKGSLLADVGVSPQSVVLVVPVIMHRRIACGTDHSAAVLPDGRVACWGSNEEGQCDVPHLPCSAVSVACSAERTTCLLEDGRILSWGATCTTHTPTTDVVQIAAGDHQDIYLHKDGTVTNLLHCTRSGPPQLAGEVIHVAAGHHRTGVILKDGTVRCWPGDRVSPTYLSLPSEVVQLDCGKDHWAAVLGSGDIFCWGIGKEGQCDSPERSGAAVRQLAAGSFHNVALLCSGEVVCWGRHREGQCAVPQFSKSVVEVAAGQYHSMALLEDGSVRCWGKRRYLHGHQSLCPLQAHE